LEIENNKNELKKSILKRLVSRLYVIDRQFLDDKSVKTGELIKEYNLILEELLEYFNENENKIDENISKPRVYGRKKREEK
jgi:hypothetical protein